MATAVPRPPGGLNPPASGRTGPGTETPEQRADRLAREAADRAYQLQLEQRDYDRWLREATSSAKQPYLDQAAQAASGLSDWNAPGYTPASPFQAPDKATALNDPGYQFLLKKGQNRIERNAQARGTIFTSGTIGELQDYGQQAASDQYDKVYGNALTDYTTAEQLRQQAYDRNTSAAAQSAQLRNANIQALMAQYLAQAQLASATGEYPGYHPATGTPPPIVTPRPPGGGYGGGGEEPQDPRLPAPYNPGKPGLPSFDPFDPYAGYFPQLPGLPPPNSGAVPSATTQAAPMAMPGAPYSAAMTSPSWMAPATTARRRTAAPTTASFGAGASLGSLSRSFGGAY